MLLFIANATLFILCMSFVYVPDRLLHVNHKVLSSVYAEYIFIYRDFCIHHHFDKAIRQLKLRVTTQT